MFPFQEVFLSYLGKKKYILLGLVLCAVTNLTLGLTDSFQSQESLLYNGIVSRIVQGFGVCMMQTACYSLTCIFFEDQKLQYMGFIQSSIGFGEVVGPFIGSTLYKYYGFLEQFFILDLFIIAIIYVSYRILPKNKKKSEISLQMELNQFEDENITHKLLSNKKIVFDFMALCLNIFYDNSFIGFLPIVLHTMNPSLD